MWFACAVLAALLSLAASQPIGKYELLNYVPTAQPGAIVQAGSARFTVLTTRLIRMEYSSAQTFEDRATLSFVNRQLPVPAFSQNTTNGVLTIKTASIMLRYVVGSPFSPSTLSVTSVDSTSAFQSWHYGQDSPGNLLGTIRSLDMITEPFITLNCTQLGDRQVHNESLHCTWGLVSRDGWVVVDDSKNFAVDDTYWWDGPNTDEEDLYIFAHGHDYYGALYDYQLVGGKIAMIPRYANGIWWTRWYDLDNIDVEQVVHEYSSRSFPLDVYVFDMDWHTKYGWGGYSWDQRLFPLPAKTLGWLHNKGLHVAANLHDNDGVRPVENEFLPFCQTLGINPSTVVGQVPLTCCDNQTISNALEDIVLKAVETLGVNFWWIDWQQGGTRAGCSGELQNPTIALSRLRATDHIRRGEPERAMVLARWGGLGSHRYQVGFSGDVLGLTWSNLAFQPYFSLTATNVGFGFWSHDLMGPVDDMVLMTRWLQWGAFSGVFRSHDRGESAGFCADLPINLCAIVRPWNVPLQYFDINRMAMTMREEFIPYIYTATRAAFDTGVSLLRPMYYDWPEAEMAYAATAQQFGQYMWGPDMLVSPVVSPPASNQMTVHPVWLPPGTWVELLTGMVHTVTATTGTVLNKAFDLEEIPIFVRGGAVVPSIPVVTGNTLGLAVQQYAALVFSVFPGASSGSTTVYEDDALTTAYLAGAAAWTNASYVRTATSMTISVVTTGSFPELPAARAYTFRVVNGVPPTSVTANGVAIPYSEFPAPNTWNYDGPAAALVIQLAPLTTSTPLSIQIATPAWDTSALSGLRGALRHATLSKRNLDEDRRTPGAKEHDTAAGRLMQAASAALYLSHLAGTNTTAWAQLVTNYPQMFAAAVAEVNGISLPEAEGRLDYSKALLASAYT